MATLFNRLGFIAIGLFALIGTIGTLSVAVPMLLTIGAFVALCIVPAVCFYAAEQATNTARGR